MKNELVALVCIMAALMICACGLQNGGNPDGVNATPGAQTPQNDAQAEDKMRDTVQGYEFITLEGIMSGRKLGEFKTKDKTSEWNDAEATKKDVSEIDGIYEIKSGGVYVLSGKNENASILIDCAADDTVRLVLNGVNLSCGNGSAIYARECKKLIITLADGTENFISDGERNELYAGDANEPDAAVFSQGDLSINGSGKLTVTGKFNNGIVSKDKLKIFDGAVIISSVDDGIIGRDAVLIGGGRISVDVAGKGIKSTNDKSAEKGYVYICGGEVSITSGGGGIAAKTIAYIENGDITLSCGGGSGAVTFGGRGQARGDKTGKGISAEADVIILGGTLKIDSSDDSIHSNSNIYVAGGSFEISTGDDAFHADAQTIIKGGDISVAKCYEGIEGTGALISGGVIKLTAHDDGINTAGGSDENDEASDAWGRDDKFSAQNNAIVHIDGGKIDINAKGDGIDSNGYIWITGGELVIDGGINDPDVPLDTNGACLIDGGRVVAIGGCSMLETPANASKQHSICLTLGKSFSSGAEIELIDSDGKAVLSYEAKDAFNSMTISAAGLETGKTYSIKIDGEQVTEISLDNTVSDNVTREGGFGTPGRQGGHGGMPEHPEGMPNPSEMPEPPGGKN